MEIVPASTALRQQYAADVPELVWATGPISYEYHFADRALFNNVVSASWLADGTLFAAETTWLAIAEGELLGIEIGMPGSEFRTRQNALGAIWQTLANRDLIDGQDLAGVLERSEYASWLNPALDADTYYIHAISVKPEARGKRIGFHLMDRAIQSARDHGYKKFQLDVLSDNPAVSFYRAMGLELLAETRAPRPAEFGIPPEYRMGLVLK
jgi:ribosomal protein S18 acetylase RimI-like enzyme